MLILSGGEPLLRRDIFEISARAKKKGFYVGLSTNGALIDTKTSADRIAAIGYDYVGISLDGIGATHDRFRRKPGGFEASLNGIRLAARGGHQGRLALHRDARQPCRTAGDVMELAARKASTSSTCRISSMPAAATRIAQMTRRIALTRAIMDGLFDTAWASARKR